MAEKIVVELEAKFADLNKKLQQIEEGVKDINKESKQTSKGISGIGKALSGIGAILTGGLFKAGAVIFEKLTELFLSNQTVVDTLSTAMNSLKIVFNDLVGFVSDFSIPTFTELKDSVIQGVINRFNELMQVFGLVGESFSKLIEGNFSGAFETIKQAGIEVIDVYTGTDKSLEKITKSVGNYASETLRAAQEITELNSKSELLLATNDLLQFQNQKAAEDERQIRDDLRLSIEDRIAANERLKDILLDQQTEQLKNADEIVRKAQANLEIDKSNIELQTALVEARRNRADVEENINGFLSEQRINEEALRQELIDRDATEAESINRRLFDSKNANAELIQNESDRIEQLRMIALEEQEIEGERLFNQIENYKIGTQARIDAEQAFEDFKFQSEQKLIALDKNARAIKKTAEDQDKARQKMLEEQAKAQDKATLGRIVQLAGEGSAIGKAAAIAQATISGVEATINAFKTAQNSPITAFFPPYPFIQAGIAAAFTAKNISAIKSTPTIGGGGGGGGGSAPAPNVQQSSPPAFNVVGSAPENQLAVALGENEEKPVKAFVVSNDVTNAQALDRNIVEQASIG
tara:strand:+ start:19242 stop:20984 length:1743 start_codon:yes stop_codon:yes gene_type:complete